MQDWTFEWVALDKIRFDPEQVRSQTNDTKIDEMTESIGEKGMLVPALLQRCIEDFTIIDGHQRIRGAIGAGLDPIPAIIVSEAISREAIIQIQIVTACHRQDLSPVDMARGIDRLKREFNLPVSEIAKRLTFSEGKVSRLANLLTLPPLILEQVENGRIPASTAYELTKIIDPNEQMRLGDGSGWRATDP